MSAEPVRRDGVTAAILLFCLGVFLFSVNDALGKWLVAGYTVSQLMLVRSLGAGLVLLPIVWRSRVSLRVPDQWGLHAVRIVCMAADSFSFYFAVRYLPLADVMTFYLAAPLIITAMSGPLLGETVGAFRWGAVLVGFVGVLIALRPTSGAFSAAALVALFGSCMFAAAITTTRKLRNTHWLPLIVLQFAGAGSIGAVTSLKGWISPSILDLGLMALVGIVSMGCFICIIKALKLADASVVAPFQYTSLVWAVIMGWLVWGDLPDSATTTGMLVIVASGLAVWWREQKRGAPALVEAVPVP